MIFFSFSNLRLGGGFKYYEEWVCFLISIFILYLKINIFFSRVFLSFSYVYIF